MPPGASNSHLKSVKLDGLFRTISAMGPSKPTFLEVFMVNNIVFRWPKPLFLWFWGLMVYKITNQNNLKTPILGGSNIFAPENGWLEDLLKPFGARPSFRGELLVLERV